MESYIIRIYRRYEAEPERAVGLVEQPENGAVQRFSNIAELLSILLTPPQHIAVGTGMNNHDSATQLEGENPKEKVANMLHRHRI